MQITYIYIFLFAATMTKIIKEMLPPDVRVARDAQDLLIECCVGEIISLNLSSLFNQYQLMSHILSKKKKLMSHTDTRFYGLHVFF